MSNLITVKVSSRYQISIPSAARKRLNIQAGDRLLVDVQDGLIILSPKPVDYTAYMHGLHKEVWEGKDGMEYLGRERDAWRKLENE